MRKAAWLLPLALVFGLGACGRDERELDRCPELDAGAPIDPVLLAFLSRARSAHHLADLREQAKDLPGATTALESLTSGTKPPGEGRVEVREVLADTRARLAELYARQGQMERAFESIDQGLALAEEPTYFRGHLFEVRGVLEERRAEGLAKAGNEAAAKAARERAFVALEEAMRIQQRVVEQATPAGSAPAR